jgi:hypothetical protein
MKAMWEQVLVYSYVGLYRKDTVLLCWILVPLAVTWNRFRVLYCGGGGGIRFPRSIKENYPATAKQASR